MFLFQFVIAIQPDLQRKSVIKTLVTVCVNLASAGIDVTDVTLASTATLTVSVSTCRNFNML